MNNHRIEINRAQHTFAAPKTPTVAVQLISADHPLYQIQGKSTELPTTQLELQMLHLLRRLRVKASVVVHAATWQWISVQKEKRGSYCRKFMPFLSLKISVHGRGGLQPLQLVWPTLTFWLLEVVGRGAGLVYHVQNRPL